MLGYEDHELKNILDTWARLVHPNEWYDTFGIANIHK